MQNMTDYSYRKNKQRNQGYSSLTLSATTTNDNNNDNDIESSPQDMKESFLPHQDPSSLPIAASRPMMEVVAPADLPEGYEFQVVVSGNNNDDNSSSLLLLSSSSSSPRTYQVRVPPGGVEQGQTFSVPYPNATATTTTTTTFATSASTTTTTTTSSIPVGHWRDSLCSCFQYGICHPHCWTSFCCTFLATGQVVRRMKLDWTGRPTDDKRQQMHAFWIILGLVVGYFVLHIGLSIVSQLLDPNAGHLMDVTWEEQELPRSYYWVNNLYNNVGWAYWIGSTLVLIRTRHSVRERYSIPAPGHVVEDVVCSICCHCCVAGQLLRHTTNYDAYPSVIFTDTGLPPHVPAIV